MFGDVFEVEIVQGVHSVQGSSIKLLYALPVLDLDEKSLSDAIKKINVKGMHTLHTMHI